MALSSPTQISFFNTQSNGTAHASLTGCYVYPNLWNTTYSSGGETPFKNGTTPNYYGVLFTTAPTNPNLSHQYGVEACASACATTSPNQFWSASMGPSCWCITDESQLPDSYKVSDNDSAATCNQACPASYGQENNSIEYNGQNYWTDYSGSVNDEICGSVEQSALTVYQYTSVNQSSAENSTSTELATSVSFYSDHGLLRPVTVTATATSNTSTASSDQQPKGRRADEELLTSSPVSKGRRKRSVSSAASISFTPYGETQGQTATYIGCFVDPTLWTVSYNSSAG